MITNNESKHLEGMYGIFINNMRSKVEFRENSPISSLYIVIDLIEFLELSLLSLDECLQHTFFPLVDLLKLLHLEDLGHFELFVFELVDEVIDLLDLGVLRVESVEVV